MPSVSRITSESGDISIANLPTPNSRSISRRRPSSFRVPLYRQAIELRLYQGLSYKTMGERFDEQPDTMRTRVYRGFQELRRKLEAGQDAR